MDASEAITRRRQGKEVLHDKSGKMSHRHFISRIALGQIRRRSTPPKAA